MTANWRNRTLFHGDNLIFLRAMNSGCVDLIATDPPFKKGRDFHATPDSLADGASFQDRWTWERDVHDDWTDQLQDDHPAAWAVIDWSRLSYGDDMGAFLCFMAVRLLEMHRVLKPTGSIYLHCDPDASHYLKTLMDAIFGRHHFRNEIVWCYKTGGRAKQHFPRKHEYLLWYGRHRTSHTFSYDAVSLPRDPSTMHEPVLIDDAGQPYQRNFKAGREYRYYLDKGVLPDDWWTDIQALNPASKERYGYPTQKPLALYDRIIRASSQPGDVVLDPFCGCATTPVAAERCGWKPDRRDSEQVLEPRQWVGIDIWDGAHKAILDRMENEGFFTTGRSHHQLSSGDIHYVTEPPERTDAGETAAPFLRVKKRVPEPPGPKMSRGEMYAHLLDQHGLTCQGCDRVFDDPLYLELDHNTPRSDGGVNHISNRVLLCGPCNRIKSNIYTLSGLRRENTKRGRMAK